ncbi:hypothetical protein [Asticcacaulis sp. AND118]|uniref:hypothetical protein n=1 Tax=Asticcacaulis sp. AND118 TaxID=2840468 RepID=UPI001CFF5952|nr:hypothetical protein [Asticcacaulis sp. AND118]UDF03875.1 hypothetical protein LH365_02175 [Asticcacaulis sp. AND118]
MSAFLLMAGILGGIIGYDSASGGELLTQRDGPVYLVAGLLLLFALVSSLFWWRGMDEAQKEAHKWAWYWGGSVGLLVVLFVFVASKIGGGDIVSDYARTVGYEGQLFELGLLTALAPPVTGYAIAWAVWWLRRR